jgi:hypothetical protein
MNKGSIKKVAELPSNQKMVFKCDLVFRPFNNTIIARILQQCSKLKGQHREDRAT